MLNFDFHNPTHIAFGQGRIADLAKLAARRFILGPIANALSGALGGAAAGTAVNTEEAGEAPTPAAKSPAHPGAAKGGRGDPSA